MKHILIISFFSLLLLTMACQQKKTETKKFFPMISYLKGQVKQMDSSLNSIMKLVYIDSVHTDTTYVPRNKFREEARDFLELPDLTKDEFQDRYDESSHYDETLDRSILTYTPKNPEKEQIQEQEIIVKSDVSGDRVSTVIVNSVINNKDSLVQKRLLWRTDESFQIVTIKQFAGQPATTTMMKVVWNEDPIQ